MSATLLGHASQTAQLAADKPRDMEERKKDIASHPTNQEPIVLRKPPQSKQSLDYVLRTGFVGGLAGCAAKSVVAPLDRVKILFQARNPQFAKYAGSWFGVGTAMRDIYKDEGPLGLFRGHSATLLRIFPYAAIKFLVYEQVRAVVIHGPEQETLVRRFLSGSAAGVASVFITYPLEVIRVRLAFETKKDSRSSLSDICRRIYNEKPPRLAAAVMASSNNASTTKLAAEAVINTTASTVQAVTRSTGLSNFYRGFTPTILGMLPYAGMSFLTHDTVGDLLRHPLIASRTTIPRPAHLPANKPTPLRYWAEFISGGAAGLVSQTASYPLEVIRRRMQVGGAVGDGHRLKIAETARLIWREKGWRGFFVGLSIGYVKIVPMAAVSFFVYERGKVWLGV